MRRFYRGVAEGREKYPEAAGLAPDRPGFCQSLLSIDAPPSGRRKPAVGGASRLLAGERGIIVCEETMSTIERLIQEIEQLDEEELEALFEFVQQFLERRSGERPVGFLEKLGEIQIDGPEDFSENFDLYLSGEKSIDAALG